MTRLEFLKSMKKLTSYYLKDMNEEELTTWYEVFEKESNSTLDKAIKELVMKNKFFPTIAELVEECKNQKTINGFAILEFMKSQGYFKESEYSISEYEKACRWLETGIIPEWFKEDMKKYSKQKTLLENKQEKVLIGG